MTVFPEELFLLLAFVLLLAGIGIAVLILVRLSPKNGGGNRTKKGESHVAS